ncbi:uncharacterized protein LOC109826380 [Asparagus officinalis]|uniref:uncharacterized protein LOC109826380 n=1 Tax=Asparagus officinalis TaxID=4686 RepID=UPI00098E08C1|nr:uncharacterized protein LOC109826380 [Asparagus officinalis]
MDHDLIPDEESVYRMPKHPSHRALPGVCLPLSHASSSSGPTCLSYRPCSCLPSSSSSSSSSSFSSLSSSLDPQFPARSSVSGAVGRVSALIDREPAFQRSRSVAVPLVRMRPEEEDEGRSEKGRKWGRIWGFLKTKEKEEAEKIEKLPRSRSVGVPILKGRKWSFPSPMRVFRSKKTAKVVQERSPSSILR